MRFKFYWLLALVPAVFLSWYFISEQNIQPARRLPYFGPKHALMVNDTTYHTVPPFLFVNQYGEPVDTTVVSGKIYISEFFFTTCEGICPIMNNNLEKVYQTFGHRDDFLILSHTVDPEHDSVEVMRQYAAAHGVKDRKWHFVTGKKPELYNVARKGYLLNAEQGDGGAGDFIHTQNFALVDKQRHLRGFYDGTDSLEINRLMQDVQLLLNEYEYASKDRH